MNRTTFEYPLISYLNERFSTLEMYLINALKFPSEEDIHQLRVEIKKLNALLNMFEVEIEDASSGKLRKSLSKVFKAAGRLRDSQVINNLFIEYQLELGEEFKHERELKTETNIEKLKTRIENFHQTVWENLKQRLTGIAVQIDAEDFEELCMQFLKSEFDTISKLHHKKFEEITLHRIRRHLKASGYIISMFFELPVSELWKSYYEEIKTTETMIGNWHDHVEFRQNLNRLVNQYSNTDKNKQIEKVLVTLKKDINQEVTEIHLHLLAIIENWPFSE